MKENELLALSVSLAKLIATDRTNPELAIIASFLSSVASDISIIIQTRNFEALSAVAVPVPITQENEEELT